jgi:hypothetical protein
MAVRQRTGPIRSSTTISLTPPSMRPSSMAVRPSDGPQTAAPKPA